jgi:hypothetical protein
VVELLIFRRVRKITKSDYQLRHVGLSVRMEQFGCQWTDFREKLICEDFQKIWQKKFKLN